MDRSDKIQKLLSSYNGVGEIVEALAGVGDGFYSDIKYKDASTRGTLPPFLEQAIGVPLDMLPSFVRVSGHAVPQPDGIGHALDVAHDEMRGLGKRIARFVFGDKLAGMTRSGNLQAALDKLPFITEVPLGDGASLKLPERFAARLLKLGAIGKQFKQRASGEETLIDEDLGNAREAYNTMYSLQGDLLDAIEDQGLKDKVDMRPLMLHTAETKQAFAKELSHFRDVRVLAHIGRHGIMTDERRLLFDLPDSKEIHIQNPKDAACALFALGQFAKPEMDEHLRGIVCDQSQKLAEAPTNGEAARLLDTSGYRHTIEILSERIQPSYSNVLNSAVAALENYRSEHLVRVHDAHEPVTDLSLTKSNVGLSI